MADATLRFDTKIDTNPLNGGLKAIANTAVTSFKVSAAAITAVSGAITTVAGLGVKYNMQMEDSLMSFTTLLGSQEKAIAKVEELKKKAADTPFEMPQLTKATETLLSFGIAADEVSGYIDMIGDISLGNAEKFSGLTLAFAQVQSTGRLMGQDLLQMINQGFNPLNEIAKMTGKSLAELKKDMENGAISADMVTKAFKQATSEGGQFYKGLENASKTASAQFATLKDNIMSLLGEISKGISDELTVDLVPMAIKAVDDMQEAFRTKGIAGLSEAVGEAFASVVAEISSYAPQVAEIAVQIIQSVANGFYDNLPTIIQAASAIGEAILSAIFGTDIEGHWNNFIGDMTSMFGMFADTVGGLLKPVGAIIEGTFKFLLDNGPLIVSIIIGIGTAMAGLAVVNSITAMAMAWKTATAALVAHEIAVKGSIVANELLRIAYVAQQSALLVLSGELTIANALTATFTTVTNALKLAWATTPFGVAAIAIGALAGGFVLLSSHLNKVTTETQAYVDETKKMNEIIDAINKSIDDSINAYQEKTKTLALDAETTNSLIGKLETLSVVENKSAEQKSEIASIVAQLNSLYPELNLQYSQEMDTLSKSVEVVKKYVDEHLRMVKLQAITELLIENEKKRIQVAIELESAKAKVLETEEKLNEARQKIGRSRNVDQEAVKNASALNAVLEEQEVAVKELTGSQLELEAAYANLTTEFHNTSKQMSKTTEATETATEAAEDNTIATKEQDSASEKLTKTISTLSGELDRAEKAYRDIATAETISASTAASLLDEYGNLIAANADLLTQYPELYAALDANNTVQENSKAIALSVWQIQKQLNIDRLKQQQATLDATIQNLSMQRNFAVEKYGEIAQAAALSWGIAAEAQKAAAGESVKTFTDMIADAKNRAASMGSLIKELENTKIPDISTGGAGAKASAGAREIKDAFAEAKLAIEDYKTTSDYTIQGEIEKWKQLGEKYKQGSKERVEINKTINQLEEKLSKDTYDKKIQDIERHREAVGRATQEELDMWEDALKAYDENSDEYNAINKKVNQVKKELAKDSFEHSKRWIDEEKYYKRLSLEDELAAWERVQSRYEKGTDERKEADRELFRVRSEIAQKSYDDEMTRIEALKKYRNISIAEEIELLRKLQDTHASGTEQRKKADESLYDAYSRMANQYKDYEKQIADANANLAAAISDRTKAIFDSLGPFIDVVQQQEQYNSALESAQSRYDSASKSLESLQAQMQDQSKTGEEATRIQNDYNAATNELAIATANLSKAKSDAAKTQAQIINENLKSQVDKLQAYVNDLDKLENRVKNKDIIASLRAQGVSSADTVAALASMTNAELREFEQLWSKGYSLAAEAAEKEFEPLKQTTKTNVEELNNELIALGGEAGLEAGKAFMENFAKGIEDSSIPDIAEAINTEASGETSPTDSSAKEIMGGVVQKMKEEAPKLIDSGKAVNETVAIGIINNLSLLVEPSTKIIDTIVQEMKDNLEPIGQAADDLYTKFTTTLDNKPWHDTGRNMVMGMVDGVNSAMQPFVDAVSSVVSAGLAAGRAVLDIQSPSRETKSDGINLILGYIQGIKITKPQLMTEIAGVSAEMLSMPLSAFNSSSYTPQFAMAGLGGYNNTENSTINNYYVTVSEPLPKPFSRMRETEAIELLSRLIAKRGI